MGCNHSAKIPSAKCRQRKPSGKRRQRKPSGKCRQRKSLGNNIFQESSSSDETIFSDDCSNAGSTHHKPWYMMPGDDIDIPKSTELRRLRKRKSAHWETCAEFGLPRIQIETFTAYQDNERKMNLSL